MEHGCLEGHNLLHFSLNPLLPAYYCEYGMEGSPHCVPQSQALSNVAVGADSVVSDIASKFEACLGQLIKIISVSRTLLWQKKLLWVNGGKVLLSQQTFYVMENGSECAWFMK